MTNEVKYKKSISIRTDEKMSKMLEELEEKLLLNTTSIMRLALVTFYQQQTGKSLPNLKEMNNMPTDIGWRQSKSVRSNIMSLIRDIAKENKKLMQLQHELLQKQLVEAGAIELSDTDVKVNLFSIYDKKEEIAECESNIEQYLSIMEIAMLDDSDLIFMNINEIESKTKDCENDVDNCINEIDELRCEIEEE